MGTMSLQIAAFFAVMCGITAYEPVAEVTSGKLVGRSVDFAHKDADVGRVVHVFKGIPYAEAPVDDLRFQPPKPKLPWDGVYDAKEIGFACIQPVHPLFPIEEPQSEDCLYINIYAPQTNSGLLPVMVWFHGGSFIVGSGTNDDIYDGTAMAAIGEVIIISVNYRLGVFGFFVTGDEHATGNYGILDQMAALQWIQENVAAFGGDANKVTIFGESAGSVSVEILMLSPLTEGLFRRAIMQSGSAFIPGAISNDGVLHRRMAHGLGKLVGCEKDNTEELVECLRTVPADEFRSATYGAIATAAGLKQNPTMTTFPPNVDGHFISDMPLDLLKRGHITKTNVDVMIGSNADEGTLFLAKLIPTLAGESAVSLNRSLYEQVYSGFLYGPARYNQAALEAIKIMYVDWENADSENSDYFEAFSQMQGDNMFVCPADMSARAYSKSGCRVYLYHMTHTPAKSLWPVTWMKAGHAEELPYVFGGHFGPRNWTMPQEEVAMSLKMIKYWTNFARTGNPNLSNSEEGTISEEWPVFEVPGLAYRELSLGMETKRALKARECAFWNEFIPKLVKHTDVNSVCTATDKWDDAEEVNEA